jgi:hypothetical protein
MPKPDTNTLGGMSSETLKTKTGKTWPEWLAALDAEGCQTMTHKEIVAVVNQKFGIGPWWQQMVTVGYEQGRNLRDKHQKVDGYSVTGNKTINVPIVQVYKAWADTRTRKKWLAEPITIRKSTPDKSLRITWADGSSLDVNLYSKGDSKSQVQLEHSKLKNAREAARLKKFWAEKVQALKDLLES